MAQAKFISRREVTYAKEYHLFFQRIGATEGTGFMYDCDEKGTLTNQAQEHSYCNALGEVGTKLEEPEVLSWERTHIKAAIIECCDCGAEVHLVAFTSTCGECGADYNMSGYRLAPREQWGEETGESASDILNHDYEGDFDADY